MNVWGGGGFIIIINYTGPSKLFDDFLLMDGSDFLLVNDNSNFLLFSI